MTQPMDDLMQPVAWMYPDFHGQTLLTLRRQDDLATEISLYTADQLREAIKKAVEAEREACAKIVEESSLPDAYSEPCLLVIAEEIRARSQT